MDFTALAELCAPNTQRRTLEQIASVESSFNPYAIGVVGGRLQRQPRTLQEAIATTDMLERQGFNYSVGLVQVNRSNFAKYNLNRATAFEPCRNVRAGALIFDDCLKRAGGKTARLGDALSCYYSGNFKTGYSHGYVAKVLAAPVHADPFPDSPAIPVYRTDTPKSTKKPRVARVAPAPVSPFGGAMPSPVTGLTADGSQPSKGPETALLF